MVDKLQTNHQKKSFYTIVVLLLIGLFCVRYFVVPFILGQKIVLDHQVLFEILDKLFTSIIVTIGLGIFLFWLTPKNSLNAQIKILQPIEIGDTITSARTDTNKWWFNGGSGRYTRSVTLPSLSKLARNKNKSMEIIIQIINPRNESICNNYITYRNGLRSGKKTKKTKDSVKIDLLSTIVSAYTWKTEQSLLNIQIALRDAYSLFRTDLSSSKAIITKEDPLEPAILYDAGTFFYEAYCEEFRQTLVQAKKLDMNIPFYGINEINENHIKDLLKKLELYDLISDSSLPEILRNVKTFDNPYD